MIPMTRVVILLSLVGAIPFSAHSQVQIVSILNTATLKPQLPGGGSLATILCTGPLGEPGTYTAPSASPLPFELGRVGVLVNGGPAPILAVSIPSPEENGNCRIDFQVPLERNATLGAGGQNVGGFLIVTKRGTAVGGVTLLPTGAYGGFFADENGYAIAQHASDNGPVTVENPAHPGEAIIAYANDFFFVWPPPPIGFPVPDQPLFQYRSALVFEYLYLQDYPPDTPGPIPGGPRGSFTNTPALEITFRGLAPGQIGVEQINFVVPANQQPGDWALFFNKGSCPDRGGVCDLVGVSSAYVKLPVR